jgi:hypothetical protein
LLVSSLNKKWSLIVPEVKLKRIYSPCISLNCWLPVR